jgi:hypothetical protein
MFIDILQSMFIDTSRSNVNANVLEGRAPKQKMDGCNNPFYTFVNYNSCIAKDKLGCFCVFFTNIGALFVHYLPIFTIVTKFIG